MPRLLLGSDSVQGHVHSITQAYLELLTWVTGRCTEQAMVQALSDGVDGCCKSQGGQGPLQKTLQS